METIKGDILNIQQGIIVHGVNCQGVMGAGLARSIKILYPQVETDYLLACATEIHDRRRLLGKIITTTVNENLTIVSAFTQEYYGRNPDLVYVDYGAVEAAFKKIDAFSMYIDAHVYIPKIGAGLANGDWDRIKGIIDNTLTYPCTLVENI